MIQMVVIVGEFQFLFVVMDRFVQVGTGVGTGLAVELLSLFWPSLPCVSVVHCFPPYSSGRGEECPQDNRRLVNETKEPPPKF